MDNVNEYNFAYEIRVSFFKQNALFLSKKIKKKKLFNLSYNANKILISHFLQRYEESLRKPLRTYRVEFNLSGPTESPTKTTSEIYTTYSAPRYLDT